LPVLVSGYVFKLLHSCLVDTFALSFGFPLDVITGVTALAFSSFHSRALEFHGFHHALAGTGVETAGFRETFSSSAAADVFPAWLSAFTAFGRGAF